MNKLDVRSQTLAFSPASHSEPHPARRLIVLVPDSEADTVGAAQKIWELANALGGRVQFLGLCKDASREPGLRRQLVSLSAMVGDGNVSVESKIEHGGNWLDIVKSHWREGDVVACFAEHRAGASHKPLSQLLESNLKTTVYVLSGLYQVERSRPSWISSAPAWIGSIGIIAGFFWAQVELTQLSQDWAHTALLYLTLFIEVGLIWAWNSLF
jgi:hypothetical protein